ncbi:MAG: YigZ family protein [Bacteroidota bacterium]|nr:YigZ family protein [Bacteroidota bacterium]
MFALDSYNTIVSPQTFVYKSKGSKFLAFAFPVNQEIEIKKHLQDLKLQLPDASHHCYAYVLNFDKQVFRANDDGEPSNTAGKPILRQIHHLDLTNVLVVVVRYFGGTLLGVAGLIEAYSNAALEVLEICEIVNHPIYERYELQCDFGKEQDIYSLSKQYQSVIIVKQEQSVFCAEIKIPLRSVEDFKRKTKELYFIKIKYIGIA